MTNKDFWQSISTIINNGFDKDGIIKLEDYAEQFFNKQLLFKRYSPSEQHGCATGGSFHVVASILAGAETPTNQLTAPEGSFKRDCQRAEAQAAVIEQWAKTTGCWVDDVDKDFEQTFGEQLAEGGEAHVYDNGNTIIKRIGLDYYIRINTPNLKSEGVRKLSNEVEFIVWFLSPFEWRHSAERYCGGEQCRITVRMTVPQNINDRLMSD